MGVCCIVFDIDGMLFAFFMNFLNIEKNEIKFFFFNISIFFAFHAISNIKKKFCVKKKNPGGWIFIFVRKTILSHFTCFMLYAIFPLHYILYSLVLILYLKCGGGLGGGGVMFFSHLMLCPTFLETKSGNTKQLFLI